MSQQHDFHYIEDQFRDELREASVIPPIAVWERIEAGLPKSTPFYVRFKWPLVASALVGIAFTGAYWSMQPSNNVHLSAFQIHPSAISSVVLNNDKESVKEYATVGLIDNNLPTGTSDKGQAQSVLVENVLASSVKNGSDRKTSKASPLFLDKKLTTQTVAELRSKSNNGAFISKGVGADYQPSDKGVSSSGKESITEILQDIHVKNQNTTVADAFSADDTYRPIAIPVEPFTYSDDEFPELLVKSTGKKKAHKYINVNTGFFMGPAFGYQFNRLTQESSSPETDNSFLEYRPHFGSHYGLAMGYDFPSRWGILVEWVYSSNEGQRFEEDFGDYVVNKSIELDYMKFPVLVRYQQAFLNKQGRNPVILNLMGGFQYSLLRSKNTFINDELALVDQKFNKHTWGLSAGAELDIYATKQLFFTIGMKSAFASDFSGFPRFKGKEGNDPMSIQTGLYARLNYRFIPIRNKGKQAQPQTFGQ